MTILKIDDALFEVLLMLMVKRIMITQY